jgi:hypothetical protein
MVNALVVFEILFIFIFSGDRDGIGLRVSASDRRTSVNKVAEHMKDD